MLVISSISSNFIKKSIPCVRSIFTFFSCQKSAPQIMAPPPPQLTKVSEFNTIPPEKPADPPPLSPGPNPGPELPDPPNQSPPTPEGPLPPLPSPPGEPEAFPPGGPDVIPPERPEPGPPKPTEPDIPPSIMGSDGLLFY
ncbi:hypothetical protein CDL12_26724 [Handroanthus impetiginosus]|uniref:Uncharacterized protein n=1 Tax=Handroanthus impetiginosus TaxID=429701 RepID=A0A2G9G637_9LAMI|nr:hypothetical protein CDL12_26724 [Handroanthus impetiginosus]